MNFESNNVNQCLYHYDNLRNHQSQNSKCASPHNIADAMLDGFESFAERLGYYGGQTKDTFDNFEELICKMNNGGTNIGNGWNSFSIKDEIIDHFESFVEKSKRLSILAGNKMNIAELREQAIDNFERFVEKSKKLSLLTSNKLRKVRSVKETLKDKTIDNFEHFVEKSKQISERAKVKAKKVNSYRENVRYGAVDHLEQFVDGSKKVGLQTTCHVESLKEKVIDEFENMIYKLNARTQSAEGDFKCYVDEVKEGFVGRIEDLLQSLKNNILNLEDNVITFTEGNRANIYDEFEELVDKMRVFGKNIVERANDQVTKVGWVREEIIDSFEDLLVKLNDFGFQTTGEIRNKLYCIREEVVGDFEDLVHRFNANLNCVENNFKGCTGENKAVIIQQFQNIIDDLNFEINYIECNVREMLDRFFVDFQYFFDDTKWMLEDRTNQMFANADCVLQGFVGQMDKVFAQGKCEVEMELYSIKYWLLMGEMLIKEFLGYSEKMVEEFCQFSEKRVACFFCNGKEKAKVFYSEVVDSLVRGFEDKLLCDNLVLEINSSRYAYNVTMSEVNFHVVRALMTLPGPDGHSWQHLVTRLTYFMPILTNYIRSETAQKDCLLAIEDVAGSHPEVFAVLVKIIHWLYEQDILSEDTVLYWYNHPCADADPENSKRVRQQVAPFIRWLEEAEEDDDDDDD